MREIYIENETICLTSYTAIDYELTYQSWLESDTIVAYNFRLNCSFPEYLEFCNKQWWGAAIYDKNCETPIGRIGISSGSYPDLTLTIFREHRSRGYGTAACLLGIQYAFAYLKINRLYAGCYEDNLASYKMLERCGFKRNPDGDEVEPHILTGQERLQYDFFIEADDI